MTVFDKEVNQAKAYLRAMKRKTAADNEDCDNVITHLKNIERIIADAYIHGDERNYTLFLRWKHSHTEDVAIDIIMNKTLKDIKAILKDYSHLAIVDYQII